MQSFIDAIAGVRIGEPTTYRNLTVFPLFGIDPKNAGYITPDEALERIFNGRLAQGRVSRGTGRGF